MKTSKRTVWLVGVCLATAAVLIVAGVLLRRPTTQPQTPSNYAEEDTVGMALIALNQRMAAMADIELSQFISALDDRYALQNFGYWGKWQERVDAEETLQREDTVTIHYQVWLLDGTACKDIAQTITIGKKEVPLAMEEVLLLMHRGERVQLFVPWYCGYGQYGDKEVPPYTNVRIELKAY